MQKKASLSSDKTNTFGSSRGFFHGGTTSFCLHTLYVSNELTIKTNMHMLDLRTRLPELAAEINVKAVEI